MTRTLILKGLWRYNSMKYIIIHLCLISCLVTNAQTITKLGEQAVFADCVTASLPYDCTLEKFEKDITALLTPQFTAELKDVIKADYFSVSIILLTDENGKIVREETDILCHYEPFKTAIKNYLSNLPSFYPKDTEQKDRRSVFTLNYTFIYTNFKGGYFPASHKVLTAAHIKPETLPLDSYPTYADCKSEEFANDSCFRNVISKVLTRKMRFPSSNEKNKVIKLYMSIKISKTGEITLESVDAADVYFTDEIRRVIKKLPKPEPAKVRGLPVASSFTVPLTVTLNKE